MCSVYAKTCTETMLCTFQFPHSNSIENKRIVCLQTVCAFIVGHKFHQNRTTTRRRLNENKFQFQAHAFDIFTIFCVFRYNVLHANFMLFSAHIFLPSSLFFSLCFFFFQYMDFIYCRSWNYFPFQCVKPKTKLNEKRIEMATHTDGQNKRLNVNCYCDAMFHEPRHDSTLLFCAFSANNSNFSSIPMDKYFIWKQMRQMLQTRNKNEK